MPTKKQKLLKAIREGRVIDDISAVSWIFEQKKRDELIKDIASKAKGEKGDKGDTVKGDTGIQGIQGIQGIGIQGEPGIDGKTPDIDQIVTKATTGAIEAIKPTIPSIGDIERDLPQLGHEIRDSLELLVKGERLDISAIKGLDDYESISKLVKQPRVGGGGGSIARNFYQLFDTPVNYAGYAGHGLVVNATETGLIFTEEDENIWDRSDSTITPNTSGDLLDMTDGDLEVKDPLHDLDVVNLRTLHEALSGGLQWYLSNDASADVGGYKLLSETNDAGANTITADGTSDDQAIDEWVTLVATPGDITISEGDVMAHIYAKVARANSNDFLYQLKVKFYRRASGGTETQLGDDVTTLPVLDTTTTLYSVHADIAQPITLNSGDRIVVKISTVRTGTAPRTNAQIVTLNIGSTAPSHITLPITLAILGRYATTELNNLGTVAINTSLISDTDSTDDLGSSSKYWANAYVDRIYLDGGAYLSGISSSLIRVVNAAGTPYIGFSLGETPTINCSGTVLLISEDFNPSTDSARDLGSSSLYWAEIYTDKIYLDADSTIEAADVDAWLKTVAINDISDVTISSVAAGEVLKFTGTDNNLINQTLTEAGIAAIAQTMYIGTTAVAINRGTNALTLAGLTLTTPDIGTPSAGTLTNCTFPTLNQNTTGTAANVSGTPALPNGTTATTQSASDNTTKLATTAYADAAGAGGGATTALSNLASVAINLSLVSDTQDTDSLGSVTKEWRNLYIGDAGRIFIGLGQDLSLHRSASNTLYITASTLTSFSGSILVGGTISIGDASVNETELEILDGATLSTTQLNYINQAGGTTGTNTTNIVFSTSPVLTTPDIGTPSAGNLSNCTALPAAQVSAGTFAGALESADHGTAATDELVNVSYGTGAAPTANTTTIGSLYITYTN